MTERTFTRRTMLRRSLATAGAGALVGAAGCSSIPNPLGGNTPYANWLPVPDDISDDDHYSFTYLNLDDIESNEDELDDESFDTSNFEGTWAPVDIDWEDVSGVTTIGIGGFLGLGGLIVEAEFDRDDAISDLEDEDFEEDSEHEGYTLMLGPEESQAYAVGDGALVSAPASEGDTGTVEAIVDAKTGNGDRYGDENDDMGELIDALGGGTIIDGRTMDEPDEAEPAEGTFDAMVASGQRAKINGESTDLKHVVVYESEDDVDTDDLEEWVTENDGDDGQFENLEDISYDSNGRKGIITGTGDTDEL
ncbi:hypothetical protein [Haloarcula rara]|uniref:hypothetical protein n=1 Tax=Haloarcula rara TaxID=3033387 RepID=UPI0023E8284C|nr:hypothetical protein [Halomicroarcula sp. SHR3]